MNTEPHMKKGYVEYVKSFHKFFDDNKVNMLATAVPPCDDCDVKLDSDGECPECKKQLGDMDRPEPYFSWRSCECCGDTDGGNREDYIAFNIGDPEDDTEYEVAICEDCVYFNEYGRLDDTAMMAVDKDECPATVKGVPGTLVGEVDGRKLVFKNENNELSPVDVADIEFPE